MKEIIMQGSPKFQKKYDLSLKVTFIMFFVVPIILVVGSIILFIIYLIKNWGFPTIIYKFFSDLININIGWLFKEGSINILDYVIRFLVTAFVLFPAGIIQEGACPYCGHYFTMKRISNDKFMKTTEREVENTYDEYDHATTMDWDGNIYYTGITTRNTQYGTEETNHYTHNAQCSCCGCVIKRETREVKTYWR